MNPSTHAFTGRKRKCIELEIAISETPVANRGAGSLDDQNGANQIKTKNQEHARIASLNKIRNRLEEDRRVIMLQKIARPSRTFRSSCFDFRAARSPVCLPQPRREWIAQFVKALEKNNIGWAFWPYKKMEKTSAVVSIIHLPIGERSWEFASFRAALRTRKNG